MKTRIIVSVVLFAASFVIEKTAERIFPFMELLDMVLPKKA